MSLKKMSLKKKLENDGLLCNGYLCLDFSGPNELWVGGDDSWELSYEGRADDGPDFSGRGIDELRSVLKNFGVSLDQMR